MPESFKQQPLTEYDWAYLAGLIDGEGCIGVYCNPYGTYHLQLRISQKNKKDLLEIAEKYQFNHGPNRSIGSYQLYVGGKKAEYILRQVFPYLRWKRSEAELAIAFCCQCMKGREGAGNKQPNKDLAEFIKNEMQSIKRRKYATTIS